MVSRLNAPQMKPAPRPNTTPIIASKPKPPKPIPHAIVDSYPMPTFWQAANLGAGIVVGMLAMLFVILPSVGCFGFLVFNIIIGLF